MRRYRQTLLETLGQERNHVATINSTHAVPGGPTYVQTTATATVSTQTDTLQVCKSSIGKTITGVQALAQQNFTVILPNSSDTQQGITNLQHDSKSTHSTGNRCSSRLQ